MSSNVSDAVVQPQPQHQHAGVHKAIKRKALSPRQISSDTKLASIPQYSEPTSPPPAYDLHDRDHARPMRPTVFAKGVEGQDSSLKDDSSVGEVKSVPNLQSNISTPQIAQNMVTSPVTPQAIPEDFSHHLETLAQRQNVQQSLQLGQTPYTHSPQQITMMPNYHIYSSQQPPYMHPITSFHYPSTSEPANPYIMQHGQAVNSTISPSYPDSQELKIDRTQSLPNTNTYRSPVLGCQPPDISHNQAHIPLQTEDQNLQDPDVRQLPMAEADQTGSIQYTQAQDSNQLDNMQHLPVLVQSESAPIQGGHLDHGKFRLQQLSKLNPMPVMKQIYRHDKVRKVAAVTGVIGNEILALTTGVNVLKDTTGIMNANNARHARKAQQKAAKLRIEQQSTEPAPGTHPNQTSTQPENRQPISQHDQQQRQVQQHPLQQYSFQEQYHQQPYQPCSPLQPFPTLPSHHQLLQFQNLQLQQLYKQQQTVLQNQPNIMQMPVHYPQHNVMHFKNTQISNPAQLRTQNPPPSGAIPLGLASRTAGLQKQPQEYSSSGLDSRTEIGDIPMTSNVAVSNDSKVSPTQQSAAATPSGTSFNQNLPQLSQNVLVVQQPGHTRPAGQQPTPLTNPHSSSVNNHSPMSHFHQMNGVSSTNPLDAMSLSLLQNHQPSSAIQYMQPNPVFPAVQTGLHGQDGFTQYQMQLQRNAMLQQYLAMAQNMGHLTQSAQPSSSGSFPVPPEALGFSSNDPANSASLDATSNLGSYPNTTTDDQCLQAGGMIDQDGVPGSQNSGSSPIYGVNATDVLVDSLSKLSVNSAPPETNDATPSQTPAASDNMLSDSTLEIKDSAVILNSSTSLYEQTGTNGGLDTQDPVTRTLADDGSSTRVTNPGVSYEPQDIQPSSSEAAQNIGEYQTPYLPCQGPEAAQSQQLEQPLAQMVDVAPNGYATYQPFDNSIQWNQSMQYAVSPNMFSALYSNNIPTMADPSGQFVPVTAQYMDPSQVYPGPSLQYQDPSSMGSAQMFDNSYQAQDPSAQLYPDQGQYSDLSVQGQSQPDALTQEQLEVGEQTDVLSQEATAAPLLECSAMDPIE